MHKKKNHQAIIIACVVAVLFVAVAGFGMYFGYRYIEKQLLLENEDDAVDIGKILSKNFSITDEEVEYMKTLTFTEMETDPINLRLMNMVSGLELRDEISNVYVMKLLDDSEVKYTVDESNADDVGYSAGTKLNGIWLLNGKFDTDGNFLPAERDDICRYLEFCDTDKKIFDSRSSFGLTSHDKWGDFITGYVPLYSVEGTYVGILGVDVDMTVYAANVTRMTATLFLVLALSMAALLVLLILAFWGYVKTKKGLADDAEMYQEILNAEDAIVSVTNAKTFEVLYANTKMSEITGISKDDYIGNVCYKKMLNADSPCAQCITQQKEKEQLQNEFVLNGRYYKRLFKKINWHGTDAYLEYITDVTAEKQYLDVVEKQSKQQEKMIQRYKDDLRLRNDMFTNAALAVEIDVTQQILVGMTGGATTHTHVSSWNERPYSEYYNYVYALTEDDYKKEIEKLSIPNLQKRFDEGETKISIEFLGRGTATAPKLYYRSTCYFSINPANNNLMAFVYTENIDEAYKTRKAVEQSMEAGMESIAIIHVADGVTRLVKSSKRMKYQTAGMSLTYDEDFVKKSSMGVVKDEQELSYHEGLLSTVIAKLEENDTYTYRITLAQRVDGLQHVQFQFHYLDNQKEDIVFCLIDVTDIYEEEQKQKQALQTALDDAKKANEVTKGFMSRMSHDMRTPMNGILGVAELSKDATTVEELRESMDTIKDSGTYLLGLINDTLDYQRIQSGKLTLSSDLVDAREVIKNICEMVKATADKKGIIFEIKHNAAETDCYIKTDAMRLKQIFVNLLSNAIKFTPTGGKVEWELKLLSQEGNISHNVLIVRDTGIGMSKEFVQNDLFKPFSQEYNDYSRQYAGSGLGLSIVKSLVELMGGHIEVESEQGEGSTFYVYLDFERVEKTVPEIENNIKNAAAQQFEHLIGKKILLTEDHPLNAEIVKRLLENKGCIVTHAVNGQVAVELFNQSEENEFNAVLMDIRMPVMDGLEATKEIRKLNREDAKSVPIIAMTANAFEEDVNQCLAAGMNAHISKPVAPQVLYSTLEQYI